MLKDSQFSHILILLVLGYLIFYLTCPQPKVPENMEVLDKDAIEGFAEHEGEKSDDDDQEDEQTDSEVSVPEITDLSPEDLKEKASEKVDDESSFKPRETSEGTDVKTAFERNIPKGVDTNTVDFNKNVLKKYDSKNYLPKEVNDKWFDTDFTQAKFKMNSDKLINTDKYVVGVDTVGQSLKNATWDLRGTIANPKYMVSPWNNSTYEPDYNLKALC